MLLSASRHRLCAALIFAVCAAAYFLARTPALDEWDSVQFAQGVGDFNLWRHRPHPPGYPLFILAGWVFSHGLGLGVPTALQLASALGGGLFVACWFALAAQGFGRAVAWATAAALATLLITWMTATKALTDPPGAGFLALTLLLACNRQAIPAAVAGALTVGMRPQDFPVVLLIVCLGPRRWAALGAFAAGCASWLLPTMWFQAHTPGSGGNWLTYPTQLLGQWRWRLDQPRAFVGADPHGQPFLLYRLDHHALGLLTRGFGFGLGSGWGWLGIGIVVLGWTFYVLERRRPSSPAHAAFWRTHGPWAALYVGIVFCCLPGDQRYYLPVFPLLVLPAILGWGGLVPALRWIVPAATVAATLPFVAANHLEPAPPVRMIRDVQARHPAADWGRVCLILRDSFRHGEWYAPPEFLVLNGADFRRDLPATLPPVVYTDDAALAAAPLTPAARGTWLTVGIFARSPLIYRKHAEVTLYRWLPYAEPPP